MSYYSLHTVNSIRADIVSVLNTKCLPQCLAHKRFLLNILKLMKTTTMLLSFGFLFFFFYFNFIYLFIFGYIGPSLLHTGFLQLQRVGATLPCGAWASHCSGFSCCGAWALGAQASVVVAHGLSSCGSQALERRLNSCGARAQLLRSMWDLPRPGLEPISPALATAPPGKSQLWFSYLWRTSGS